MISSTHLSPFSAKHPPNKMATQHLATWACNLKYSDLPENVIQAAVRSLYNWVGCAIGGSKHPATTIAVSSNLTINNIVQF
jgi:2-methylcitrate dehydratase PrpD